MNKRPALLSLLLIAVMCFFAEYARQPEIIFPEIAALATGGWISKTQPWRTSKINMLFLMSVSSIIGVCIVRFVPLPLIFQISLAFLFICVALILTQTSMYPAISACILPILLRTETLIYPLSVITLTFIIILTQYIMEKIGVRQPAPQIHTSFTLQENFRKWLKLFLIFVAISIIPVCFSKNYFIVPPILVAFAECSNPNGTVRSRWKTAYILMAAGACIGTACRVFFNGYFNFPITVCAVISFLLLLLCFHLCGMYFPPAGAMALLPMLLPLNGLLWLPVQAMVGTALFFAADLIFFPQKVEEQLYELQ